MNSTFFTAPGFQRLAKLLDLGVNAGIVEKSGSWFSYGDQRIGQGRNNAAAFLIENASIAQEVENKIRLEHGLSAQESRGGKAIESNGKG